MKEILVLKETIGKVSNAADIFKKIEKINIDYFQENVIVFYLNVRNKVIKTEVVFKGGIDACILDIRIVLGRALRLNAVSIIVAHNHPSGSLIPSNEDMIIKRRLYNACTLLGLKLLDFIIFNKNIFFVVKD